MNTLPRRWTPLRRHEEQQRWWNSTARFNVIVAGRRSGKTETFKRKLIKRAIRGTKYDDAKFFAGAPVRDQAKRIFWEDLKALTPPQFLAETPSESELIIRLINGSSVYVVGLDKPQRIEGTPWDGGGIDEIANAKPSAWALNIRPALSDRNGWCDLFGVPEGRDYFYDLYMKAKADTSGEWGCFTWPSSDILSPAEIAAARRDLDELSFAQEYEASFVNFMGRAYYAFNAADHCSLALKYDNRGDLIFTFDFNVSPGTAAIIQEQKLPGQYARDAGGRPILNKPIIGSAVIGEVYIPANSNTVAVCNKLIADWGGHQGNVYCYGDATGGASGTAKTTGSDWDLIQAALYKHFGAHRVYMKQRRSNPKERARVNAVNTRLLNGNREIHLMVNPEKAPHVVKDFDGVVLLEGGSGEIDKKKTPKLTHLTDGIGYYIEQEFPTGGASVGTINVVGV